MLHVIPNNDEQEHELSQNCKCNPETKWQDEDGTIFTSPMVVHNAFDCREASEVITGESMGPGMGWFVEESY